MNPVETFRWQPRTRRVLGSVALAEDADGSRRMIAEGGWLAVVYPPDPKVAYVETIERAPVERSFAVVRGSSGLQLHVTKVKIESVVGRVAWEARLETIPIPGLLPAKADPRQEGLDGVLRLPDGTQRATFPGGGFFESTGLVRGYGAWRDGDVAGGWTVVTEVDRRLADEVRPLLAALPLLLFSVPPVRQRFH